MTELDKSKQWISYFFSPDEYPTALNKHLKILIDGAYAYIFTNENPLTNPLMSDDLQQFEFNDGTIRPVLAAGVYKKSTDDYEISFWLESFEDIKSIPLMPESASIKKLSKR